MDTRFLTVEDFKELKTRIFAAAKEEYVPGTRIEVEWGAGRLPMEKTAATHALFERYSECQKASGLGSAEHPLVGGGSDGCTIAALGIPTIDGLGPRGTGYHTTDEMIELDSLIPKAQALLRYLVREFHRQSLFQRDLITRLVREENLLPRLIRRDQSLGQQLSVSIIFSQLPSVDGLGRRVGIEDKKRAGACPSQPLQECGGMPIQAVITNAFY